jgi:hypothetical protein
VALWSAAVGRSSVWFGGRGQWSWVGFSDVDDRRPVGTFGPGDWDATLSQWQGGSYGRIRPRRAGGAAPNGTGRVVPSRSWPCSASRCTSCRPTRGRADRDVQPAGLSPGSGPFSGPTPCEMSFSIGPGRVRRARCQSRLAHKTIPPPKTNTEAKPAPSDPTQDQPATPNPQPQRQPTRPPDQPCAIVQRLSPRPEIPGLGR